MLSLKLALPPWRLLLNLFHNIPLQTLWLGHTPPPLHHAPIPADQELLKVPLDPLEPEQARLLRLHPLVDGLGLVAVDVGLAEDGEADAVVELAKLLDLVVGARVLAVELVAGEAKHDELVRVLGGDSLVEFFEALELGREAAFGGGVDNEDHLAGELGEGVFGSFF